MNNTVSLIPQRWRLPDLGATGRVFVVFLGFQIAAGLAGPFSAALSRLALVVLMLVLVFPVVSGMGWRYRLSALGAVLLPLLGSGLDQIAGTALNLLGLLFATMLVAGARPADERGALYRSLGLTVACLALVLHCYLHSAIAWQVGEGYAALVSRMTSLGGRNLAFGPTYAGLWPFLAFLLFICVSAAEQVSNSNRLRLLCKLGIGVTLGGIVVGITILAQRPLEQAVHGFFQALMSIPLPHLHDPYLPLSRPTAFGAHWNLWLLSGTLAFLATTLMPAVPAAPAAPAPRRRRLLAGSAGAGLAIAGILLLRQPMPSVVPNPQVVFADLGGANFTLPQSGRYGLINAGMFGAFHQVIQACGIRVLLAKPEELAQSLEGAKALVIINPKRGLNKEQIETVWQFVQHGGSLLVMGDHTDIFGLMAPLNALLQPIGVRFNFDSAFPLRRHWENVQGFHPHSITTGLGEQRNVQTGTGASLTLDKPQARPVVVGRYSFADFGNRLNDGRGAFLGDYRYQLGERLGDTVLVAAANYGMGKVLVFGDTTQFQVLSMPESVGFVLSVINHLVESDSPRLAIRVVAGLAALTGLILFFYAFGVRVGLTAAAVLLLATGVYRQAIAAPRPLPPALVEQSAVIDNALSPRVPWVLFEEGSIGGLYTALYRSGYFPVVCRYDGDVAVKPRLVAFLAPMRTPQSTMLGQLNEMVRSGTTLLVVAAPPHLDPANRLLELCGVSVSPYPLGPAPVETAKGTVEFTDAWRIDCSARSDAIVHAAWRGNPILVEVPVGHGRCIVLSDLRFLEDENLEGESEFHPVNVPFFEDVLRGDATP